MITLSKYLKQLSTDKDTPLDDRILYLYDTKNNTYYTKVIYPEHIDFDGVEYSIPDHDDPFTAYDKINVVRAWTVTNAVNCMMGIEALTGNYCESEV